MKILKFHHIIRHLYLYFTLIISQIINVFYQLFIIKRKKTKSLEHKYYHPFIEKKKNRFLKP